MQAGNTSGAQNKSKSKPFSLPSSPLRARKKSDGASETATSNLLNKTLLRARKFVGASLTLKQKLTLAGFSKEKADEINNANIEMQQLIRDLHAKILHNPDQYTTSEQVHAARRTIRNSEQFKKLFGAFYNCQPTNDYVINLHDELLKNFEDTLDTICPYPRRELSQYERDLKAHQDACDHYRLPYSTKPENVGPSN